jgi:hypothetical protein
MTHTFAELEISQPAWNEIAQKLRAAGYDHAFVDEKTIDMHGIGLTPTAPGLVEMTVNEHGQRFFRYPERVQPIDFVPKPTTLNVLGLMHVGEPPPLGAEPARPIETNIPALQGMEIAQEPLVLDIPAFLKP